MSGWIKLHRKLLAWEWYSKPVVKSVFIHSLLRANHKDGKWQGKEIKRGSFISSIDKLSTELGHSRQEIRTALKHLKSTNELTTVGSTQHTVFIVINYENYQETTSELTNDQPTPNQQLTTNKNVKNDNNEKKDLLPELKAPAKKYKFDSYQMEFAEWMHSQLLILNPNFKKPNLESWANTLRLMLDVDKRDSVEIGNVFAWANKDDFWSSNILSPVALRKQFDKLVVKMKQPVRSQKVSSTDGGDWATKYKDTF